MSYSSEFPDYDGDFFCPKGWMDGSWHNDTMPKAVKECKALVSYKDHLYTEVWFTIWQDYVFEDHREYEGGKRYMFEITVGLETVFRYETDSLLEIQNFVKGADENG